MTSINGHIYGIKDNMFHKMFEGDLYCNLFDNDYAYSMTYKINKDPFVDKTWTNIEYRADVFEKGNIGNINDNQTPPLKLLDTFSSIEVWNEYQHGFSFINAVPKFRVWRADIPRDNKNENPRKRLNRIRNPWIMLKLTKDSSKDSSTEYRMEFHDLLVKYLQ
jgi:hypothetical protein